MYRQSEGPYILLHWHTKETAVLLSSEGLLHDVRLAGKWLPHLCSPWFSKGHFSTLKKRVAFCQHLDDRACDSAQSIKAELNLKPRKVHLFLRMTHTDEASQHTALQSWVHLGDEDRSPWPEFCCTVLGQLYMAVGILLRIIGQQ